MTTTAERQLLLLRNKELQDALFQLGLPKSGNKKVLVDRLLSLLMPESRPSVNRIVPSPAPGGVTQQEYAAQVIDKIFKKRSQPADPSGPISILPTLNPETVSLPPTLTPQPGLHSTSHHVPHPGSSPVSSVVKAKLPASVLVEKKEIRCPCGHSRERSSMVMCTSQSCRIWQHSACVLYPPEKIEDPSPAAMAAAEKAERETFLCELCRLTKSDPFFESVRHVVWPMRAQLDRHAPTPHGDKYLHRLEHSFFLDSSDVKMLNSQTHELLMWSILFNDKVKFRIHWPMHSEVRVGGQHIRVVQRPGQQALGLGGRDEPGKINFLSHKGANVLRITYYDNRPFAFGIRLVRRRTDVEVMAMVPSVVEGESLDASMGRVSRCVGGGFTSGDGARGGEESGSCSGSGSDDELELIQDFVVLNLKCPLSATRIKVPGRFRQCPHIACFDLDVFVRMNRKARKWQCPTCGTNSIFENIVIDPFLAVVTSEMANTDPEITEIELKSSGTWRPHGGPTEHWRGPPTLDSLLTLPDPRFPPEIPPAPPRQPSPPAMALCPANPKPEPLEEDMAATNSVGNSHSAWDWAVGSPQSSVQQPQGLGFGQAQNPINLDSDSDEEVPAETTGPGETAADSSAVDSRMRVPVPPAQPFPFDAAELWQGANYFELQNGIPLQQQQQQVAAMDATAEAAAAGSGQAESSRWADLAVAALSVYPRLAGDPNSRNTAMAAAPAPPVYPRADPWRRHVARMHGPVAMAGNSAAWNLDGNFNGFLNPETVPAVYEHLSWPSGGEQQWDGVENGGNVDFDSSE